MYQTASKENTFFFSLSQRLRKRTEFSNFQVQINIDPS